jgi:hypothetical protein
MSDDLLPARFLFRFSAPCRRCTPLWTDRGLSLDESYRLVSPAVIEGQTPFAEVRAAWSAEGVGFWVQVRGKKHPAWCRAGKPEDSDGVQIWIDTRDVHNVHRASRFCHRFILLPGGAGSRFDEPCGQALPINRAREQPRPASASALRLRSQRQPDGYTLHAMVEAAALTGFDPDEYPRLGFTYAAIDRELGEQTFAVGSPLPYQEDPSLWATVELTR